MVFLVMFFGDIVFWGLGLGFDSEMLERESRWHKFND